MSVVINLLASSEADLIIDGMRPVDESALAIVAAIKIRQLIRPMRRCHPCKLLARLDTMQNPIEIRLLGISQLFVPDAMLSPDLAEYGPQSSFDAKRFWINNWSNSGQTIA